MDNCNFLHILDSDIGKCKQNGRDPLMESVILTYDETCKKIFPSTKFHQMHEHLKNQ